MSTPPSSTNSPDLALGIPADELPDGGMLAGHVGGDAVLLARNGTDVFAVGATCTHYGGPLAEGLMVGDTVRCPWHHACFSLRTGEAVHAPAFAPLACWTVEQQGGKIFVRSRQAETELVKPTRATRRAGSPERIVIIGGGAGGFAAADTLRRRDYGGGIVMLSSDAAPPVDRPNLSKDYLAGNAPEEWLPLRPADFYIENGIDVRLNSTVTDIDPWLHQVTLAGGESLAYDRLLLATGAEPVRLSIPGADQPHVHVLRSLADCEAIIEQAKTASRAVVLGASFIGLEVAASLCTRGIEVHVAAPEQVPMERVLGPQLGAFIRSLHAGHGVVFHLNDIAVAVDRKSVQLRSGGTLQADFIVVGIGVRPRIELAESMGLTVDRGVVVDAYLQTSAPDIFAAGDIARWPDPHSGASMRVEHWVVAERQGQIAARNMLGQRQAFDAVPFFWSQHYDVPINYVGHAENWDDLEIEGDIAAQDCLLRYKRAGRVSAVASIHRDVESLRAELAMERERAPLR